MYYKLACTNVNFDSTYENNIRFESRADQQSYFNVEKLMANAPVVNFRIGTLLNARAVLRAEEKAVNAMLYNYCIVEDNHDDANVKYLYYFIKKITFDVSNQIIMDLELDVIQTFYIDCTFEDCIINRAHLDRWVADGTQYTFNTKNDSKLFEREAVRDFPKYISKREKAKLIYNTNFDKNDSNDISTWLYNNIQAWVYIYVQKGSYKYYSVSASASTPFDFYFEQYTTDVIDGTNAISQPYATIVFPIYKTDQRIKMLPYSSDGSVSGYIICKDGFTEFEALQEGFDGNVLNVKVSPLAPFRYAEYIKGTNYRVDESGNLILLAMETTGTPDHFAYGTLGIRTGNDYGLLSCFEQYIYEGVPCYYSVLDFEGRQSFTKSDIIANGDSKEYNPKMLSADFKTLTLSNSVNTYNYDILKLQNSGYKGVAFPFRYYESLAPDVSRTLCVFSGVKDDNGVYQGLYGYANGAMIGLFDLMDLSMPYSKNQLEVFLANNKNFYLQRNIKTANQLTNAGVDLATGGIAMYLTAGILGRKQVASGLTTAKDAGIERIQSDLTIDNMANAPESVYNASGNSAFYTAITDCGIYYEIRECIENEAEQANDIIRLTGFSYGRIDNVKNVDNIRVNFNYVQADLQEVNTAYGMNDEIKNRFRQIFAKGVRLWNNNENIFNENASNYEVYLNE
jgi:hypothetical protein